MAPPLSCTKCGTSVTITTLALDKKLLCLNCRRIDLGTGAPLGHGVRMGDDEGGGDWGGGGDDSSSEEESEEEEEEEGEDGKKKKKKAGKKKGFVASLMSSVVSYVIGGVVLVALCCCFGVASWMGLIKGTPQYVGKWEKVGEVAPEPKKEEKAEDKKDNKTEDKKDTKTEDKKDDKKVEKKEEKKEPEEPKVEHKLTIVAGGTGTYEDLKANKTTSFKWKADDEKKTIDFEIDGAGTLWKDSLKGKVTFNWSVANDRLTLTPPTAADALTFDRVFEETKTGTGGGGGGRKKRR